MSELGKKKKAPNWTAHETHTFLDLMIENNVMEVFDGKKGRSLKVYQLMSRKMKDAGFDRDEDQLRFRFIKLKSTFMKQRDNNQRDGLVQEEDPYYEKLEALLGNKRNVEFKNCGYDSSSQPQSLKEEDLQSSHICEMEYDALNQNSSQVGFQDVSTFVVRDQNDCDLEETVVDDSNIPPAPKRKRTSYCSGATSVTEETNQIIKGLRVMQAEDQAFLKSMQQQDHQFLRDLLTTSQTIKGSSLQPFYYIVNNGPDKSKD